MSKRNQINTYAMYKLGESKSNLNVDVTCHFCGHVQNMSIKISLSETILLKCEGLRLCVLIPEWERR